MDRKVVWTEQASGDIEAIVRYIARDEIPARRLSGCRV
jgi:plasmid stabilization system protein ParE